MKIHATCFSIWLYFGILFSLCACNKSSQEKINNETQQITSPVPSNNGSAKSLSVIQDHHLDWWDDAVIYQIWLRSFYDQDGNGSGDINGLTSKLPYLQDIGVKAIWLTPIFKSPSYHGYDTVDFYQIDPNYGSLDDFDNLVKEGELKI